MFLPASADTVLFNYDAGTSGSAPDPVSAQGGNWMLNENEDGNITTGSLTAGGVSPDGSTGYNAWNTQDTDQTPSGGLVVEYTRQLSAGETAEAAAIAWRYTAQLRVVDEFNDTRANRLEYGNGSKRFIVWLDLDFGDDLVAHADSRPSHRQARCR